MKVADHVSAMVVARPYLSARPVVGVSDLKGPRLHKIRTFGEHVGGQPAAVVEQVHGGLRLLVAQSAPRFISRTGGVQMGRSPG
jgi:hypothetical protein